MSSLNEKLTWVRLAQWRESFMSKAFTLLSVASFALAYFGPFLKRHDLEMWRLEAWFVGSILFFVGYAISSLRMPSEFSGSSGDLVEIASRMTQIQSFEFYESRKDLASKMVDRFKRNGMASQLTGPLAYVEQALKFDEKNNPWSDNAARLYHSDVALRQYDRRISRFAAGLFMALGLTLLLAPTATNFFHAIMAVITPSQ